MRMKAMTSSRPTHYISCRIYFLAFWFIIHTQSYPCCANDPMTDALWRKHFRQYVGGWCRWLCRYKLIRVEVDNE